MAHTPGPWKVGYNGGVTGPTAAPLAYLVEKADWQVISARDPYASANRCICVLFDPDNREQRANASLIAAAPELLEALKGLAADVEKIARDSFSTVGGDFEFDYRYEDPDGYVVWDAAREAIAKAEGRA